MRPSTFEYYRAESLDHALSLLADFGEDGGALAGGQSLVPMMNLRLARPQHLVDVNGLGLDTIEKDGSTVRVGALVRHERFLSDDLIATYFPVFPAGIRCIGHPTIRRNGSIGGSLANADPTAELPLLSILHDAQIVASSTEGERRVPATEFFEGAYMTALKAGEMITAVELPIPPVVSVGAFVEMSERRGDFAIAAGAALLQFSKGQITHASVGCSGVAQTAIRVPALESALAGRPVDDPAIEDKVSEFAMTLKPPDDHSAAAEYRRNLVAELLRRAIDTACVRAKGAT